jgi:hypothetical protein
MAANFVGNLLNPFSMLYDIINIWKVVEHLYLKKSFTDKYQYVRNTNFL